MTAKWRILAREQETSVENTDFIVKAICCLHNFLIDEATEHNPIEMADTDGNQNGSWRRQIAPLELAQLSTRGSTADGTAIRERLARYFSNEGAVPWQNHMIYHED